jgi:hypothetical protein
MGGAEDEVGKLMNREQDRNEPAVYIAKKFGKGK